MPRLFNDRPRFLRPFYCRPKLGRPLNSSTFTLKNEITEEVIPEDDSYRINTDKNISTTTEIRDHQSLSDKNDSFS